MTLHSRAWTTWLPLAGIGTFVGAYFYAAAVYPGGTRLDPHTVGYSHLANYWCDLLDRVSYAGRVNPGRPVALTATVALPLALVPLWLALPRLFGRADALGAVVRAAGPVAMLAAALVFTPLHDLATNVGAGAGLAAFVATLAGLARGGRTALVLAGLTAGCCALANYALWATGTAAHVLPAVQKAAYASFFVWVVLTVVALAGQPAPGRPGMPSAVAPAA